LPVRPLRGPEPYEVIWRDASNARVLGILHNPAYAGSYVYGRRRLEAGRIRQGAHCPRTRKVPIEDWEVCLQAAHPGYISWEEFMENQKRLANNAYHYAVGHKGAARKGSALLQGIAVCGRCGRRMSVRYTGPQGSYPVYTCHADRDQDAGPRCQEVRALPVDAKVEQTMLEALTPDRIAIAIAAHPDDIEFYMAGTLLRLKEADWEIHYLNLSSGNCGSLTLSAAKTRATRRCAMTSKSSMISAPFDASRQ
jgi:hypothetical protein